MGHERRLNVGVIGSHFPHVILNFTDRRRAGRKVENTGGIFQAGVARVFSTATSCCRKLRRDFITQEVTPGTEDCCDSEV